MSRSGGLDTSYAGLRLLEGCGDNRERVEVGEIDVLEFELVEFVDKRLQVELLVESDDKLNVGSTVDSIEVIDDGFDPCERYGGCLRRYH